MVDGSFFAEAPGQLNELQQIVALSLAGLCLSASRTEVLPASEADGEVARVYQPGSVDGVTFS